MKEANKSWAVRLLQAYKVRKSKNKAVKSSSQSRQGTLEKDPDMESENPWGRAVSLEEELSEIKGQPSASSKGRRQGGAVVQAAANSWVHTNSQTGKRNGSIFITVFLSEKTLQTQDPVKVFLALFSKIRNGRLQVSSLQPSHTNNKLPLY